MKVTLSFHALRKFWIIISFANISDKGYLYWRVGGYSNVTAKKVSAWYHTEESYLSVEATAYALLTEMHYGEVEHVGPIVKWLIEQRNSAGMFKSTQVNHHHHQFGAGRGDVEAYKQKKQATSFRMICWWWLSSVLAMSCPFSL